MMNSRFCISSIFRSWSLMLMGCSPESSLKDPTQSLEDVAENDLKTAAGCFSLTSFNWWQRKHTIQALLLRIWMRLFHLSLIDYNKHVWESFPQISLFCSGKFWHLIHFLCLVSTSSRILFITSVNKQTGEHLRLHVISSIHVLQFSRNVMQDSNVRLVGKELKLN